MHDCAGEKFYIAHCRHGDPLLEHNQTNNPEILLRGISDARVTSLAQTFHAYAFEHARETLSVKIIPVTNRFEACEGARSAIPRVLFEGASLVLPGERHRLQELRELHIERDLSRF